MRCFCKTKEMIYLSDRLCVCRLSDERAQEVHKIVTKTLWRRSYGAEGKNTPQSLDRKQRKESTESRRFA